MDLLYREQWYVWGGCAMIFSLVLLSSNGFVLFLVVMKLTIMKPSSSISQHAYWLAKSLCVLNSLWGWSLYSVRIFALSKCAWLSIKQSMRTRCRSVIWAVWDYAYVMLDLIVILIWYITVHLEFFSWWYRLRETRTLAYLSSQISEIC